MALVGRRGLDAFEGDAELVQALGFEVLATSGSRSPNAVEGTNNADTEGLNAGHLTKAARVSPLRVEDTTRHWKPHASSSRTESALP
jgi:hypothetical protein